MNLKCAVSIRRIAVSLALAFLLAVCARTSIAQAAATDNGPANAKPDQQIYQTLYLANANDQQSLNDIQTDLRNMLPRAKIYGVVSQRAISIRGTQEDIEMAQKMVSDLDRPRKVYRITYTITDTDGGQPKTSQHYTLIVASGDRTVSKQGARVPIITGKTGEGAGPQNTQVQYVDVGLNIEASLTASSNALNLRSKVEVSSVAGPSLGAGAPDPNIRQTVLDQMSALVPGKPLTLGSLDVPGSSRHEEVDVVAELVQ